MFCPKCGKEIPEHSTFCLHCGNKIAIAQAAPLPEPEASSPKYSLKGFIVAALIIAVVILGVAFVANQNKYHSPPPSSEPSVQAASAFIPTPTPTPEPTPYWVPASIRITKEAFALGPGQYYYFPVKVDDQWRKVRLQGRFRAEGGGGNDVYACLTDEDGLENFKNHHQYSVWYESGKITVGAIDRELGPGNYYLIFSNTFSVFAHKAVTADIQLHYEYLKQP